MSTKLTSRDQQRIETRNRVFQAAISEFIRVGFDNAQVGAIVTEAGVSVGTYYRYFPTKNAVLIELLQRHMSELTGQLLQARSDPQADLRTLLKTLVDLLFDAFQRENETLVRELFALLVRQTPMDIDWLSLPLIQPVVLRFQEEQRQGRIAAADVASPIRIFFAAIMGFLTAMNPVRHRQEAHEFIEIFLRGIQPPRKSR